MFWVLFLHKLHGRAYAHGSILHCGPIELFLISAWLLWWNVLYPVCGMVYIKDPLVLIGKSSPCGSSGFHLWLSSWSFTVNKMCWVHREMKPFLPSLFSPKLCHPLRQTLPHPCCCSAWLWWIVLTFHLHVISNTGQDASTALRESTWRTNMHVHSSKARHG